MEGYKIVSRLDLHVGDEVIVEHLRWDFDKGFPIESVYYRAIAEQHKTLAGMEFELVAEPNIEWPNIPPWMRGRICAYNGNDIRMWMKEDNDENHA